MASAMCASILLLLIAAGATRARSVDETVCAHSLLEPALIKLHTPETVRVISSPGWPREYRRYQLCYWRVEAPIGQTIGWRFHPGFELQPNCNDDYVRLSENSTHRSFIGEYCGKSNPSPGMTHGPNLLVKFKTDKRFQYKGFRMAVQLDNIPERVPEEDAAALGIIVGGAVGGFIVLAAILVGICCCCSQGRLGKALRSSNPFCAARKRTRSVSSDSDSEEAPPPPYDTGQNTISFIRIPDTAIPPQITLPPYDDNHPSDPPPPYSAEEESSTPDQHNSTCEQHI